MTTADAQARSLAGSFVVGTVALADGTRRSAWRYPAGRVLLPRKAGTARDASSAQAATFVPDARTA